MNKEQLADALQTKCYEDIKTKEAANRIVSAMFDILTDVVSEGDKVTIYNFGTFTSIQKHARKVYNPTVDKHTQVSQRTIPKFIPSKTLKDKSNNPE